MIDFLMGFAAGVFCVLGVVGLLLAVVGVWARGVAVTLLRGW